MRRSKASLLIDDVADRLWDHEAQYDAEPNATAKNIARLIDYFGKTKSLTDIDHTEAKKMVAWRRGHHVTRRGKLLDEDVASAVERVAESRKMSRTALRKVV